MLNFRNDINLLRALAIIFIVLFHYKVPLINNGFIGVDIFFVISGYLMTSIIFGGLNSNTFSYFRFMKARFKRIVPALLLLVIALWIFSYFQVFNFVYQRVVKEIAYAVEFFSNVKYYRDVGYFDIEAQRKWLLHTWSLAVEFQFYLIYPIALIVLKKIFNLQTLKWFILLAFLLSLASSIYFSYIDQSASYFLLHNRAWQLLAGALVFLFPLKISKTNLVQYLTVILLIAFLFLPSFEKSWGGFISIIPIALAMLFLYSQANSTMLSKNVVLKYLGLWSYSIYLWHWVIYAGLNYFQLSHNYYYMLGGIVVSIICGATSYYTVERNFRYKTTVTFIIFVAVIFGSNYAYKSKINNNTLSIKIDTKSRSNNLFNNNFNYITLGDSHLEVLGSILNGKRTSFSAGGCPYLKNTFMIRNKKLDELCKLRKDMFSKKYLNNIKSKKATIFWIQEWNLYFKYNLQNIYISFNNKYSKFDKLNKSKTFEKAFIVTLALFSKKFKKVIIMLDVPQQQKLAEDIYTSSYIKNNNTINKNLLYKNSISLKEYKEQQSEVNSFIRKVASKYKNVVVLDPTPYVCDKFRCPVGTDKVSYYSDNNHLTVDGAMRLLPLFKPYFSDKKIIRN